MILDVLISFIILPNLWQNHFISSDYVDLNLNNIQIEEVREPERIFTDVLDIEITAQSALAIDSATGKILYEKNSEEPRSIASITKLMTALIFLDYNPGWQEEIYTIASDRRNGGIIHLNTGEVLTIKDLFYTALIASDNDSAMALSRSTGLSEKEFITAMNKKAKELDLNNTYFADPTGLDHNNKSTSQDIVKLLKNVMGNKTIVQATSTAAYEFEVRGKEKNRLVKIKNTDQLVNSYLNIIGGKTGHLELAGYCLAVKIEGDNNQEIIIVVLGSQASIDRFQDVKAINDYVFTNYQW